MSAVSGTDCRRSFAVRHVRTGRMRRGVTLLELILVFGVLLIILAITWPMLERPLAYERLRKAADMVMAEWTTARVDAMRTGQEQTFRFEPLSDKYFLGLASGEPRQLPEGVIFANSVKSVDTREEAEEMGAQEASDPEIWFYPDGTSSDVPELVLRNEYGMQIRLVLRGLTGVAAVDTDIPDAAVETVETVR
jgi:Tfp pilus assembly protein FimT